MKNTLFLIRFLADQSVMNPIQNRDQIKRIHNSHKDHIETKQFPQWPYTDLTHNLHRPMGKTHTEPTGIPHRVKAHTDLTQNPHRTYTDPEQNPHRPKTETTQNLHRPKTEPTQNLHRPCTEPTQIAWAKHHFGKSQEFLDS